ncbi:MAG: 3-hydroxyacyl-CoA dehydrogenase NAD-binding domain-containing protein [Maricaulaceae bacterium]|jgi:3-hydroxyacyl-CoA dehydrogenase/enoyl-CoA hydratase/3-hydroxybutyryl-CoA epimerase
MNLTNFTFETDADGIALVTFDMPDRSMNVLSQSVIDDIVAFAEKIATDDAIKGAVITSGKDAFCAGADLEELGAIFAQSAGQSEEATKQALYDGGMRMKLAFRQLETCGKPVAAAINGLALGGGFEVTLACHYRIAANDNPGLKLGLPEAMVGVLPGGGGTQRLPRLIGAMNAFDLMLQGKQISVEKAAELGVVHETAPSKDLVAKAKAWVKANPDAKAPWDQDKFKVPGGGPYHPAGAQIFQGASPMLRKNTWGNYPAQRYILSCVYEGLQVDIDTGLRIEARYFAKLMMRPESRNMIRSIFLSKQDLDKGGRRPVGQEKAEVKKIAVIGAGFMGAGIANVSAQAKIEVVLIDVDQAGADRGKQHIVDDLAKRVSKGRMDQKKADEILARVTPTTDYSAIKNVDLVVEAVFENSDLKNKITKAAEEHMKADAVFGTNTSTIPITGLSEASNRPENFIGIHFFSPVERMMLVEIIQGKNTGDYAISRAIDFVTKIKKTPILVQDTRGFYCNRCVMRFGEQGLSMLSEGVLPALIENGARIAGMPMGPLELMDMTAIDLAYKIQQQTKKDLGDAYEAGPGDPIIEKLNALERFGQKTKKGFYDYGEKRFKRLWPELDQFAVSGVLPEDDQPSVQEIKDRILYAQAIEAARTMEEAVVADPREADVGSILAWGFAPYTGGVLSFIDTIGAKAFVERADQLAEAYGKPFQVPELLRDMAKKGETFYGRFGAAAQAA